MNVLDEKKLQEEYLKKCKNLEIKNIKLEKKLELPKIIVEFQRPSYIENLENLKDKKIFEFEEKSEEDEQEEGIKNFFCDQKKDQCKINFNLEKSFS
jgi:hypothetical protein